MSHTPHPYLFALSMFVFGCAAADSDAETPIETSGELKVLTYNVHGLPSTITGNDTPKRMSEIAPRLYPWDIVGLQEDFDESNHDRLTGDSPHSSLHWFSERLPDRAYGAGLSVLAHAPVIDHTHQHYSSCNGVLDASSDCLASKGFQAIRLRFGQSSIDVYNTHLEAGGGAADTEARQVQIEELVESLNGWSSQQAVLFTGDFNLRESDPTDLPLLRELRDSADLVDACDAVGCDEPDHIDQILFRSSDTLEINALEWGNASVEFQTEDGSNLSDHPAISATVEWSTE